MADGHRKYPVDYLVLHHSVGPEFVNDTDKKVQDWFSTIGKSRGYKNGAINPKHYHPSTGKLSYAMAHYALRKCDAAHGNQKWGNKYGWRLTLLIKDPFNNVTWHASNWPINQRSIGIETCGNYVNKKLPNKALMLVADFFRAHDKKIGGKLQITGHKQFMATACPGQIFSQCATLIDMINNPDKWNKKLWPIKDDCESKLEAMSKVIKIGEQNLAKVEESLKNALNKKVELERENKTMSLELEARKELIGQMKEVESKYNKEIGALKKQVRDLTTDRATWQTRYQSLKEDMKKGTRSLFRRIIILWLTKLRFVTRQLKQYFQRNGQKK